MFRFRVVLLLAVLAGLISGLKYGPIGEILWYASGLLAGIGTIVFMVIEEIRKSCWWIKWRG